MRPSRTVFGFAEERAQVCRGVLLRKHVTALGLFEPRAHVGFVVRVRNDGSLAYFFGSASPPRASKTPAAVRRLVALLEREPTEVQEGVEEIARAVLRTVRASRGPARRR